MRTLHTLFESMRSIETTPQDEKVHRTTATMMLMLSLLENLISDDLLPGEKLEVLSFIQEQLQLLMQEKRAFGYSAELLDFASLVYTISPHAYAFIRRSGNAILPHPSTIMRECRSLDVSPANEQNDDGFPSYKKRRVRLMKPHERRVTLMIDEVHIQQSFEYNGGELTGTASNSTEAAKTAHVFMTQSLLSPHKNVAHILLVARIDAEQLRKILKKVIMKLEEAGLTVVAVISDYNAINRKVMSLFSSKGKLDICYAHPVDSRRPLFFVADPVHLLKCVRNNWLNQRNLEKCMFYPAINPASTTKVNGASLTALKR
ncbi:uncharacterized protein LOC121835880 [Ixodes scapularis]|uniref:uncharacterized protein LOC121835880 n=1 Tax=Ixodes scapularis TaxID=6945 RepID=UPI001C37FCE7|nr:uncharacterized protein LOC121835880 [Ixodes scapularis]